MEQREEKLVKLTFKETGKEFFFGSYAAIFQKFSKEEIGVSLNTIWNTIKKNEGVYENKKISIITTTFIRSAKSTRK